MPFWLEQDWVRLFLLPGLLALSIAIIAWLGDWRRRKRTDLDNVGWMNWTTLFFVSFLAACLLLLLALAGWRKG